jgi:hypothetical protein
MGRQADGQAMAGSVVRALAPHLAPVSNNYPKNVSNVELRTATAAFSGKKPEKSRRMASQWPRKNLRGGRA